MVDRIDKTDRLELWKVQESTESKKGRDNQEQDTAKDTFASMVDKTDWELLLSKREKWKRNIQVLKEEIDRAVFKKINLKTDPSLIRMDIELKGGEKISPAFVFVSRMVGLKLKNLNPGDVIPLTDLLKGEVLHVTVPTDPKLFAEVDQKGTPSQQKDKSQQTIMGVKSEGDDETVRKSTSDDLWAYLKLKDTLTGRPRYEIAVVYGVLILSVFFLFGLLLLL